MTQQVQGKVVVIGCGFVADLYMRSFETFPNVTVIGAYDVIATRAATFCSHWNVPAFKNAD